MTLDFFYGLYTIKPRGDIELINRNSNDFTGIACLLFLLAAGTVFASGKQAPENPALGTSLVTKNGPIKGVQQDGIYVYKGIPYAKAPVGDLRFAPPQDVEPWTDVLDCTKYGPMISQWLTFPISVDNKKQSEGALILNVWTPAEPQKADKLPVYVFIHGGGFGFGTGSQNTLNGTSFAQNGVVTVTINYRLSTLGFFASNETYKQYGTTGNWGLLDQIKALEWIRDNIEDFGGDPAQVTIGGESAGSYSVSALILSPQAEGLFHGAIMESGTILSLQSSLPQARGDLQKSIEASQALADVFGVSDTEEGLKHLRQVDPYVLNYLSPFMMNQASILPPFYLMPVFDGAVLPKDPVAALHEGNFNKVNLLIGFNHDEGTLFIPSTVDDSFYESYGSRMVGEGWPVIAERFPVDENNTAAQRTQQVLAYSWFTAGSKVFADTLAHNNSVFMYNYNFAAPGNPLGAYHAGEIPHVFNTVGESASEESKKVAQEMHTRWINFIKNGDPNSGVTLPSATQWPKYDPEKPEVIFFDTEVTAGTLPDQENLDFVAQVLYGTTE
ncbi:MAG: carboxylesterase family protein [Treponema sp.]|jgi:para-nitrobenzyl esterase|nr:carboxylesterase family protein [Treponema sp.]